MLPTRKPSRMDSDSAPELQAVAWVGGMGISNETGLAGHPIRRHSKSEQKPAAFFSRCLEALFPPSPGFLASSLQQVVSAFSFPAFRTLLAHTPAMRSAILTTTLAFIFTGCVSAHKKGRTIHERFDYQIVQPTNGDDPEALLKCHEIWLDEFKGGGVAFLSDPSVTQFASFHTNQTALGGGSTLTIGSGQSVVSTNGIIASGEAINQIIQGIGAAVGQAANKSVTGTPLKP